MGPPVTGPALRPERCDGCGRCEKVCERRALKTGPGYLFIDRGACDGCGLCVHACERGAIEMSAPGRRGEARGATARGSGRTKPASPAASAPGEWTIPEALAVLAAFLALFVAEEALLSWGPVRDLAPGAAAAARLAVLSAYYAAQLALVAMLARRRGAGLLRAFRLSGEGTALGHKAVSVFWTFGMLGVTLAAMVAWGSLTTSVGWGPPDRLSGDLTALFGSGPVGLVLTLALAAALAPLAEELVFRGVVLSAVRAQWGDRVAIVVSSGVFAAFHFSAWQIVPVAVLGMSLGWLTVRRGSLWPAICLHAAYNGVAVLAAFWLRWAGIVAAS